MLCVPRPSTSTWAPHCACCGRSAGRRCSACAQQRSPQPGSLRQPSWGIKTKAPLGHPAFARCSSPAAANSSSSSRCRCVRLRGVATLQRSLQRLRSPRHTAHTLSEPATPLQTPAARHSRFTCSLALSAHAHQQVQRMAAGSPGAATWRCRRLCTELQNRAAQGVSHPPDKVWSCAAAPDDDELVAALAAAQAREAQDFEVRK